MKDYTSTNSHIDPPSIEQIIKNVEAWAKRLREEAEQPRTITEYVNTSQFQMLAALGEGTLRIEDVPENESMHLYCIAPVSFVGAMKASNQTPSWWPK